MPRFQAKSDLRADLNQAVDAYFAETGLDPRGGWRMVLKTTFIVLWAAASWAALVFWASSWAVAIPLMISLALALSGIGFCVMHDGGHGSYAQQRPLNRVAAIAIDVLGGSSYVWNFKHNVLHHTYTNIEEADDDIAFSPFFRLAPGQPRYVFHRLQWLYWPFLLCFLSTKWWLLDDYQALITGKVAGHKMPRPGKGDLAVLFGGKLASFLWIYAIPLAYVDVLPYVIGHVIVASVWGFTMGAVFQLAHAVEGASFYPPVEEGNPPLPWAEHQIATTVDFGRSNRLLTWFVGGLNFQVEHHLFPKISHLHYPQLAVIVREVAARHGVEVLEQPSLTQGLLGHVRYLYRLGHPEPSPKPVPVAA